MAIDWEIHGLEFGSCNCDYSCPCQFEALPTHGDCRGMAFYRIDRGHFGEVSLNGAKMGAICAFPGPVPEGHGKLQIFIDSMANEAQRDALATIMRGEEAEPFSNIFSVYAALCDEVYDPIVTEIDFEVDKEGRTAKCVAHGLGEASGEPIIGAAGNQHRAQICLPNGIEFRVAEVGRGRCQTQGKIELEVGDGYAQFNEVHLNRNGVVG